jgi:hypothetical protein
VCGSGECAVRFQQWAIWKQRGARSVVSNVEMRHYTYDIAARFIPQVFSFINWTRT